MSGRVVQYRSKPSEYITSIMEQVQQCTLYLLNQNGPTSFVLSDTRRKFRVMIGTLHSCSCKPVHTDPCVHIMFVLLKIFRIPRDHPLAWQMAFIDSEINDVLRGSLQRVATTKPTRVIEKKENNFVSRRELEQEEVCPICYEDMVDTDLLIYCRSGCGRNLHSKCMKVWAKHQGGKSISENVTCPLCRIPWTSDDLRQLIAPKKTKQKKEKQKEGHIGIRCNCCSQNPIIGPRYKCSLCNDFNLCETCFKEKQMHPQHPFVFRVKPLNRSKGRRELWFPAERISNNLTRNGTDFSSPYMSVRSLSHQNQASNSSNVHIEELPSSPTGRYSSESAQSPSRDTTNQSNQSPLRSVDPELEDHQATNVAAHLLQLQYRDIDPNDYEALIQLHEEERKVSLLPQYAVDMLPCRTIDQLPEADDPVGVCSVCLENFELSQIIKTLPCHHEFHKHCIDEWLLKHNDSCVLCHQAVFASQEVTLVPSEPTSVDNNQILTSDNINEPEYQIETDDDATIGSIQSAHISLNISPPAATSRGVVQNNICVRPSILNKHTSTSTTKKEHVEPTTSVRTMVIAGMHLQNDKVPEASCSQESPNHRRITSGGKINKERVSRARNHNTPTVRNTSDLVIGDGPANQKLYSGAAHKHLRVPPQQRNKPYSPVSGTTTTSKNQHNATPQLDTLLLVSQRATTPMEVQGSRPLISRSKSTGAILKRTHQPLVRGHRTTGVSSTLRRLD